jgi:hypothetical protein
VHFWRLPKIKRGLFLICTMLCALLTYFRWSKCFKKPARVKNCPASLLGGYLNIIEQACVPPSLMECVWAGGVQPHIEDPCAFRWDFLHSIDRAKGKKTECKLIVKNCVLKIFCERGGRQKWVKIPLVKIPHIQSQI